MCADNDFRGSSSGTRSNHTTTTTTTNDVPMRVVGVAGRAQERPRPKQTGSSGLICFNMTCRMSFRDIPW
jgi:hypothetical protein